MLLTVGHRSRSTRRHQQRPVHPGYQHDADAKLAARIKPGWHHGNGENQQARLTALGAGAGLQAGSQVVPENSCKLVKTRDFVPVAAAEPTCTTGGRLPS